jgi:hypothetical protein
MPVNWKMDALEQFFGCSQGKCDFRTFAADLAQSLGTLPSGTISTTIYKYHILFFSHPLLYLRMRALQGFDIDTTTQTPDQLIALMAAQWDSLVADNSSRSGRSLPFISTPAPAPTVPLITTTSTIASPSRFIPLTDEEKNALSAVRGCWNCRGKPTDPGWVPHQRHTCPGNAAIGARPGKDFIAPISTVAAVATPPLPDSDTSDEQSYSSYSYPSHSGVMAFVQPDSPDPQDENTESDSD